MNHHKIKDIPSIIRKILSNSHYHIHFEELDSSHIKLISLGTASHSAHPELGDNAISKLLIVLYDLFSYYHIHLDILDYFASYIGDDYTGKNLGINYQDESGNLTLNTAQFFLKDHSLNIGFNLRIPVTVNFDEILKKFNQFCNKNLEIETAKMQAPLYLKKDNLLVQKLCAIFNDYNHSHLEPEAIGGGTYARAFENCVSFGPQMPGAKDMCHQSDEYISIDNLMFCTKVYAEAILSL